MNKPNLPFNLRTAYKSVILLLVFFVPFTALHEFGHVLFCSSGNYEVSIFPSGTTLCYGAIENSNFYHASGGILAGIAATILALSLRKHDFVLIAFLSFGIANGFNAIIETIQYRSYIGNSFVWTVSMAASNYLTFFGLLFVFGKNKTSPVHGKEESLWPN